MEYTSGNIENAILITFRDNYGNENILKPTCSAFREMFFAITIPFP